MIIINESIFFTSPAGAVAKFCDEYICLSVCLSVSVSEDISGTTRAIYACCPCPWLSLPPAR